MPSLVLTLETPGKIWRNRGLNSLPRARYYTTTNGNKTSTLHEDMEDQYYSSTNVTSQNTVDKSKELKLSIVVVFRHHGVTIILMTIHHIHLCIIPFTSIPTL